MILDYNNKRYGINPDKFYDLSIPLNFNEKQLRVHDIPEASVHSLEVGTENGGSYNWSVYILAPHSHCTHSESVNHIASNGPTINEIKLSQFIPATLITVTPTKNSKLKESYNPELDQTDIVITQQILKDKLNSTQQQFHNALIIRTTPNNPEKIFQDYQKSNVPFFTNEAIKYLNSLNIQHILIDLPSLDRMQDTGTLSNHHLFWNVPLKSRAISESSHTQKSITELIYVPDDIPDGNYFLNLQIANISGDASPCRPLLFPIHLED